MATLLIGGGGLIGTALVKAICERGEDLVVFSGHLPAHPVEGCTYYQGDLREYGSLNRVFKNHQINRVIHNAGISSPKLFADNIYKIYSTNVGGVLTSVEAALMHDVQRYIYISTAGVYDPAFEGFVSEDTPRKANIPYRATKIACEEIVRNYNIPETASLRVSYVYGPGRVVTCPIRQMVDDILKTNSVTWESGADQVQDYIYIDDVVEGICRVAFAEKLRLSEYNLGSGVETTFGEIAALVKERWPDANISIGPGTLNFSSGILAMDNFQKDFGWKPQVSIRDGMNRYFDWLEKNL